MANEGRLLSSTYLDHELKSLEAINIVGDERERWITAIQSLMLNFTPQTVSIIPIRQPYIPRMNT